MPRGENSGTVSAVRFAIPIAIENTASTLIAMVFSMIIGGISSGALAAVGTSNTIVTFLTAALSLLTTGSAVLISRYVGAGDLSKTTACIEQSLLLTVILAGCITLFIELFAQYILKLLIPGADASLFSDTKAYLRVLILSYPFLMLYNVGTSIMRASGNSRATMYVAVCMNLIQLACSWLFLRIMKLDLTGAGLSAIIARFSGAAVILFIVIRSNAKYHIRVRAIFRPDRSMFRTILRVGMPASMEQMSVQGGYLLANSLVVGLGTEAASIYQIVNTIVTFPSIPQGVMMPTVLTVVGQKIGAGDHEGARRSEYRMWLFTVVTCMSLGIFTALLGTKLTSLYTKDIRIAGICAALLWVQLGYQLFGGSINSLDPALRAGGENRFVMLQSAIGVWLIRLPFSWLMGYTLGMGIWGIYWANLISLASRAASGCIKRAKNDWIHKEI
ncbi:MAG: MATE family efflux transporter [Clostridia bacterium]|nr:MATE family efflux transporter [Clostridia bacterium]